METKRCITCKIKKPLTEFGKDSSRVDGLHYKCKECHREYQQKNSFKYREKRKNYMDNWYKDNQLHHNQKSKQWRENNLEKSREIQKKYRKDNLEKVREYDRKWKKNKLQTDQNYKIKVNLRERLRDALKSNYKKGKTLELLGCSIEEYVVYLEQQFDKNMSWNNYGIYWEIDHIKQLHTFNLNDEKEQKLAFNYKNTRPLTIKENRQRKRYE